MNKKNAFLLLVIVFSFTNIFAQTEIGYFIKKDDSIKVKLYLKELSEKEKNNEYALNHRIENSVQTDGANLYYYDANNKKQDIKHKLISEMFLFNTYYLVLPLYSGGGMPRLIATSDKGYKLTEFIQDNFYIIFAFDENNNMVSKTMCTGSSYGSNWGKAYKTDDKETKQILEVHFSGCPKLKQQIIEAATYNADKNKRELYLGRPNQQPKMSVMYCNL